MWPFKKKLPKYLKEQIEDCPYKAEPDCPANNFNRNMDRINAIRYAVSPTSEGDEQNKVPENLLKLEEEW